MSLKPRRAVSRKGPCGPYEQTGVALIIVVWFIAGMSLLVAGIVSHARVDTRLAQLHVAGAKAAAVGDGAIQLMMASLVTGKLDSPQLGVLPQAVFRLGEIQAQVTIVPVNGLIDINAATAPILQILFSRVGGIDTALAKSVAGNVVRWRVNDDVKKVKVGIRRFLVAEDLLRVPGVDRTLLDAIRDYVAVGEKSRGGTNWAAAPEILLEVLKDADPQRAANLVRQRTQVAGRGAAPAVASALGGMYRVDAAVRYGDDTWLRRRWVKMEAQAGSALPWRVHRTEAPRMISKAPKGSKRA